MTLALPGRYQELSSIALANDGRIVVAGSVDSNDVVLARFLADGSLDSSFGTGAIAGTTVIDLGRVETVRRLR